ncbi:MAG: exodeoxyribonuclease III [Candidatus Eremiobacteraeota bacterium]|nr:exodeoxyribonuclease III [Candidatus Eremiobacteraeota bacterium]
MELTITTWNVNSLRVRLPSVLEWIKAHGPSVLCLQETKIQDHDFPAGEFSALGYESAWYGQKTYNGVSIHTRGSHSDVRQGLPDAVFNEQKRVISLVYEGITVVNAYIPQGESVESDKFAYKLAFLSQLRDYLSELMAGREHVVLAGDLNIAPDERDLFDAELFRGQVMFHPREHAFLDELRGMGLSDALRIHSGGGGIYSWWDYRGGAFWKNQGIRLDHLWISPSLAPFCSGVTVDTSERKRKKPSDHTPVTATLRR